MSNLDIIFLLLFLFITLFLSIFYFLSIFKNYQLKMYSFAETINSFKINLLEGYLLELIIFFNIFFCCLTEKIFVYISLSVFFVLTFLLILKHKPKKNKNKVVFTKRFIRFFVLFILLNIIIFSFLVLWLFKTGYFALIFANFLILGFLIFMFAHFLIWPLEKLIKFTYIKKAQKKLKEIPNLKVIAITGSFGKTSVKNYLFEMLKTKYKVCKTQKSYNTDMGITKVILNDLKFNDEILILEMGADKLHDINKLCKIVKPDYSIVTGVTNQHLKTFKSFENIVKTKFELIENTKESGVVVLNAENEITKEFFNKTNIEKYLVGFGSDFYAVNLSLSYNSTSFILKDGENECSITTKLLGKHNVINLLLAGKMAKFFGVNLKEIQKVIEELEPVEHRLNLIENCGKFILDDSFNSNSEGVKSAIDVLKTFPNKKIVITPGIVELGKDSFKENYKLGKLLKDIDYIIITNDENKNSILDGLQERRENVFCVSSLLDATKKLQEIYFEGDCVLFLNDLPDCYS